MAASSSKIRAAGLPGQDVVLYRACIEKETYGDHVLEVKFDQAVQVRSVGITASSAAVAGQQIFRGWARDSFSVTAARFVPLFGNLLVPQQEVAVLEHFFTDHLVLRGKFKSVVVQLRGALSHTAQLLQEAAEQQLGEPLLPVNPPLGLPRLEQQQQPMAAPRLALSPAPLLPLARLPPSFVAALAGGVAYWRQVRLSHSRIEANPPQGRLEGLTQLADSVLAALRGRPGGLQALLAGGAERQGGVSWESIAADALDMTASWCSLVASARTYTPFDMEVGVAGLCGAILLACCPATAALFLAVTDERQELLGAAAVRGVLTVPSAPPLLARYGLGLAELLLGSCPAAACATLLGGFTPLLLQDKQRRQQEEQQQQQEERRRRDEQGEEPWQQQLLQNGQESPAGETEHGSGHKQQRRDSDSHHQQQQQHQAGDGDYHRRYSSSDTPPHMPSLMSGDDGGDAAAAVTAEQHDEQEQQGGSDGEQQQEHSHGEEAGEQLQFDGDDDDDDGGLYDELGVGEEEEEEERLDVGGSEEDEGSEQLYDEEQQDAGGASQDGGGDAEPAAAGDGQQQSQEHAGNGPDAMDCDGDAAAPSGHGGDDNGSEPSPASAAGDGGGGRSSSGDDRRSSHAAAGAGPGSRRVNDDAAAAEGGGARAGVGDARGREAAARTEHREDRRTCSRHDDRDDRAGMDSRQDGRQGGRRSLGQVEVAGRDGGGGGGVEAAAAGRRGSRGGEAAADPGAQRKQLARRRGQARQLYQGLLALALQPRRADVADSCMVVLRRAKAFHALTSLQSTVDGMLCGSVSALLLPTRDFMSRLHCAAMALADLSELALLPPPPAPAYHPGKEQQQQGGADVAAAAADDAAAGASGRGADPCVLQLLLSFRVAEQLAVLVDIAAVHAARLHEQVKQQQQLQLGDLPSSSQQAASGPHSAASQLHELGLGQADLLASARALLAALTGSPAGWAYLRAALPGLTALATAVSPSTQLSLTGGEFAADCPAVPGAGRQAAREALLQRSCGPWAAAVAAQETLDAGAAVAGELSGNLQRLLLVAAAVGALEAGGTRGGGGGSAGNRAAAVMTLVQACCASELGRQATVAGLASSPYALKQLLLLLRQRGQLLAAAAGGAGPDEAEQELAGLLSDEATRGSDDSALSPQQLPCEALYAPDLLLAVLSERHPDTLLQWLPLAGSFSRAIAAELQAQDRWGAAAAAAAFPSPAAKGAIAQQGPLDVAAEPAAATAAVERQQQTLLQLAGYVTAAQGLLNCWKEGDGTGCGSGRYVVGQLAQLLPPLLSVKPAKPGRGNAAPGQDADEAADDGGAAAATAAAAAAAAAAAERGAAAVAGAAPPWGEDVDAGAAVQLVTWPQQLTAAVGSFSLLALLLQGPAGALRQLAAAAAHRPAERAALKPAMNPAAALNPNGALGPGGPLDSWAGGVAAGTTGFQDGFGAAAVAGELLEAGVLGVLERGLRAAVCALEASTSDLLWAVRGGDVQDDLERLRARTAAASLLLAAARAAAGLLLQLAAADAQELSGCGLLDAIICAHTAVVTCHEGLAAGIAPPSLVQHLADATNPTASPVQRSAAMAAAAAFAARSGSSRTSQLLLEARQLLAVCLCCWQRYGWWPDCVSAVLGAFPAASPVLRELAAEAATAREKGERGVPPAPAPRQGPRQLLAALLVLGDVCPGEWPPAGASQAMARQADNSNSRNKVVAFCRPSHMQLRAKIAPSLEANMAALANLVNFGAQASCRLVRAAAVRLCVRAGSIGGGMAPFLVPILLEALRGLLDAAIKAQQQLKQRGQPVGAAANAPQLSDGRRVVELLIPLSSKPAFKTALLDSRAVGALAKYLHKLASRSKDEPDAQAVIGLLVRLLAALCNPDVSLSPLTERHQREAEDTPLLRDGRDMVAALLASAPLLSPANMTSAAALLVGPCHDAGGQGLAQHLKGQTTLRQGAQRWFNSQAGPQAAQEAAEMSAEAAQVAALEWTASTLLDTQPAAGHDAGHAAAREAVAAALRQLAAAPDTAATEAEMPRPIMRFAKAVQDAVAVPVANVAALEDPASLLDVPPLLLACDLSAADFWAVSAAAEQQQQQRPKRLRPYTDMLPADPAPVSLLLGSERLVAAKRPRVISRAVMQLQQAGSAAAAAAADGRLRAADEARTAEAAAAADEAPIIPGIVAPRRSATVFAKNTGSRKASLHVDHYQAMAGGPPAAAGTGKQASVLAARQPRAPPAGAAAGPHMGRPGGPGGMLPPPPGGRAGPGMAGPPGGGMARPQGGQWPAGMQQQQQQQQWRQPHQQQHHQQHHHQQHQQQHRSGPPPDPRQRQQQQQQQQQQHSGSQRPPADVSAGAAGPDSPGGSDLLGGLAAGSPSYQDSPEYGGGGQGDGQGEVQQEAWGRQEQSYLAGLGSGALGSGGGSRRESQAGGDGDDGGIYDDLYRVSEAVGEEEE